MKTNSIKLSKLQLKNVLSRRDWNSPFEEVWQSLAEDPPVVAILAPPFDTIPSLQGNAIYTLIERLSAAITIPNVILAKAPPNGLPSLSSMSHRILYYKGDLASSKRDKYIPYRIRKHIWGTSQPSLLKYARSAANACSTLQIKLIIVEDIPIFASIIKRTCDLNTRVILHQHSTALLGMPSIHWRRILYDTDAFIFVANHGLKATEAKHGQFPKHNAHVIYNGVNLNHFDADLWREHGLALRRKLDISDEASVMLYVGRIIPGKGVIEAVNAFLAANIADAHFIIVGSLEASLFGTEDYTRRLHELGRSGNIHLVGSILQKELPAYYAAANVVIVPSLQSEGLPKTVTEALAMGKPVIASDRGGIWEILNSEYSGWSLSDPADHDLTARIIRQALSSVESFEERTRMIIQNSRPKMDELDMFRQFQTILDELLQI